MKKNNKLNRPNRVFIASAVFLATLYVFSIEGNICPSRNSPELTTAEVSINPEGIWGDNGSQINPNFKKIQTQEIVQDIEARVSDDFPIPSGLENRVGFWVNVYSEYSSDRKIIHHLDFPWITYEVFDVSSILSAPSRFKWTNPEKAERETMKRLQFVKAKVMSLHKKLKKCKKSVLDDLANKTNIDSMINMDNMSPLASLDPEELKYLRFLQELPGSILKNVKEAGSRIRVQTGQKDFFQNGLRIASKYFPHMEQILMDYGLPPEISRLPLVESSFNWAATSKVGAAGLWQFMDNTGKKFLTINSYIDERTSPIKSTEAAAELIKENYKIMGKSWPLAITAWNHGPGGLKKAVKQLKTTDIVKIIKYFESRHFSFASENFYSEFLAALYVEKYADKVFDVMAPEEALIFESYTLTKRLKPSQIFNAVSITQDEFIALNPDLKKAVKFDLPLPKGLVIFVHPDRVQDLVDLSSQKLARNRAI
ncbi:MAG: lytic transglycosylase domain-containing protein [Bdellovibrionaceae bacterium]|nr:lytic transglycosylase domain-containing protein [Pseudobdellovibrionaceae bacterium]